MTLIKSNLSDAVLATHAMSRFALGGAPGLRSDIENDPRGWVLDQLEQNIDDNFPQVERNTQQILEQYFQIRQERTKLLTAGVEQHINKPEHKLTPEEHELNRLSEQLAELVDNGYQEQKLRLEKARTSKTPVLEQFAHFYTNHFSIDRFKHEIVDITAFDFERQVVRANINGHFRDMVLAAIKHPAMLTYLDNRGSVGPNSLIGRVHGRTLSENFARELLELHTVSSASGYSQEDIVAAAKLLSGHTFVANENTITQSGKPYGEYWFDDNAHEPGPKTILGKTYTRQGEVATDDLIDDLIANPATARFIATKLARHFIADEPPQTAVEKIAQAFMRTDGHLPSIHKALIETQEAWQLRYKKARSGESYAIAALRTTDEAINDNGSGIFQTFQRIRRSTLKNLGHFAFHAPAPSGWENTENALLGITSFAERSSFAGALSFLAQGYDPQAVEIIISNFYDIYGPLISRQTRDIINNVKDTPNIFNHYRDYRVEATLLSPEMMYR